MHTIFHQFELRFDPILDFPQKIKTVLVPYARIFPNINIVKENSVGEQITFIADQEFYNLSIYWDKIILRYEGDPFNLVTANSIIEDPFIEIFKKIRELDSFGNVTNVLFYTLFLNADSSNDLEKITESFKENFLSTAIAETVKDVNDIVVTFETENDEFLRRLDIKVYKGINDLINRKVSLNRIESLAASEQKGSMIEFKFIDKSVTDFSFSDYKRITNIFKEEINKYEKYI